MKVVSERMRTLPESKRYGSITIFWHGWFGRIPIQSYLMVLTKELSNMWNMSVDDITGNHYLKSY